MSRPSVEPLLEGRNAWRLGVLGFFTRIKGLILTALITVLSMGAPWWWPEKFSSKIEIELNILFFILILILGSSIFIALYYLRKRSIRSLDTKYYLHQLAHDIRDKQTESHERLSQPKTYTVKKQEYDLKSLLKEVCENISAYFKLITGDESVCVAIRLARFDKQERKLYYRTYARSKGLNAQRKKHSEDIPSSEGIPRYLKHNNNSQGVLIYNDLDEAAINGTYKKTKCDEKYPDDIKTMIVAPLNAWSGSKECMIGLLYITSRKNNIFKPIHVDSVAFAADVTASAIANSVGIVKETSKNRSKNKGG